MNEPVKPCPFCGEPPYVAEEFDPTDWWFVECRTINCVNPSVGGRTSIESAIAKWNQRAPASSVSIKED